MSEVDLKPVFTAAGLAAIQASHQQGLAVKVTHIALGDGAYAVRDANGLPLDAARARAALQAEKVRTPLTGGGALTPNQVLLQGEVTAGAPEFWITEVGFFTDTGVLLAVWSSATTNLGWRGSLVPWIFRFVLAWADLPPNAITVNYNGDAAVNAWSLAQQRLEAKVRHTVTGFQPWDDQDDTQLTDAISTMIVEAIGSKSITTYVGSGSNDTGWVKALTWQANGGNRAIVEVTGASGYSSGTDSSQGNLTICMTMGNATVPAPNLNIQAYAFGSGAGVTGIKVRQGASPTTWEIWLYHPGAFWAGVLTYNGTSPTLPDFTGATSAGGAAPVTTAENPVYDKTIHTVLHSGFIDLTGSVMYFARNTAPAGFLKANGAAVSRTAYAALYAAIGTTYGAGDGATTFNLPDLRAEFPRGWDDARGIDAGRVFGSAQAGSVESHTHTFKWSNSSSQASDIAGYGGVMTNGDGTVTGGASFFSEVSGGGTETRPRNIALLACIKF